MSEDDPKTKDTFAPQRKYQRNPEKHRKNNLKYYHAHRKVINDRRQQRYAADHEKDRLEMDPRLASRMNALRATPRRVLQQSWTRTLFAKMTDLIAENASSSDARKTLRWAFRLILTRAEKDGLAHERNITPPWLAGFPQQTRSSRKERVYRSNFGRMLLRLGIWSEEEHHLLVQNLAASFKRPRNASRRAHVRMPAPSPPGELCRLVQELAYRCGLSTGEMRDLRVTHIQADGLRIPPPQKPSRLIPKLGRQISFGDDWDEIPKAVLDAYLKNEEPIDYLFFSRSPRDKKKPTSRSTLNGAVVTLRPGNTVKSLREQHLQEDFRRARSLQEARFHLRNIHCLDNQYVHNVIAGSNWHKGYANEADTIPIPAPYLLAAMCASRSVPEARAEKTSSQGGERYLTTWHDLMDYEITVDWKRSFANKLNGPGKNGVRALRLLHRAAFDFWFEGRRMKLPDIQQSSVRQEDRDLLDGFATTRVTVQDRLKEQTWWAGNLFEYGTIKRSFRIPLIEEMNRHAWHNQCLICWHPERESIEGEMSEAASKETRKKGYNLIAGKYGVSFESLKGHNGRRVARAGRGETQRKHFSTGPVAPIVRCPRKLFWQPQLFSTPELMIYSLLLLKQAREDVPELTVSTQSIEHCLGLRLNESQLSVALNHLGSTGGRLIRDFRKEPSAGFRVVF